MLAGIATAVKAIKPTCAVLAAEPEGLYGNGADCAWAWAAGEPAPATMPPPETVCDGLRAKLGDLTWPIVRDKVDGVLVVTEREVVEAMRLVFERAKLVVEPSGAAGVAAALGPAFARGTEPRRNGDARSGRAPWASCSAAETSTCRRSGARTGWSDARHERGIHVNTVYHKITLHA